MKVRVRLFAVLRERAGSDEVELELSDEATVAEAIAAVGELPGLGEVIGRVPVRMAVNRDYASEETRLASGDELALIPPVSGGADVHARVLDLVARRCGALPGCGPAGSGGDSQLPGDHPRR
jgi:MoaE-MoaD fusion protein